MPNYWNAAGQCFPLPERPLEPPDCWGETEGEESDDEQSEDPLSQLSAEGRVQG